MQYILALIPFIGWGSGDIFGAYLSRKIGSYNATFYAFLFGIVLMAFFAPFYINELQNITIPLLILNIFLGVLYVLANFFINEAFKLNNASITGVIIQSGPVLILILSNLIFRDTISPKQILWIVTVFVGVFLCAINLSDFIKHKISLDKGMKFAIAAPIMASFYFVFFRLFVNQYGWYWASVISFLTLPIGMFISKFFIKEDNKLVFIKSKSLIFPAIMSALLIRGGDIALNLGLSMGFSATVTPIAGAAPILFVILSSIFFKDKISKQ